MPIPFIFGIGGGAASIINSAPGIVARFDASTGVTSASSAVSQWNDLSGLSHHLLQASGANQPIYCPAGVNNAGTAQAGSTGTTLNLATSALAYNSLYVGMTVTITAGTCAGQSRTITGYVGATKVATVAAWTGTPDNTSVYSISAAYASVFFDGAAHFMKCTAFTLNQPETIYLVAKQVSWTINKYFFDGNTDDSAILYQSASTPNITAYAGTNSSENANLAVGTRGVIAVVFNGASSSLQVNQTTAITGNFGANNAGGFTLAKRAVAAAVFGNIQVYKILIFNTAHDAATRAAVIAALMSKWGVA